MRKVPFHPAHVCLHDLVKLLPKVLYASKHPRCVGSGPILGAPRLDLFIRREGPVCKFLERRILVMIHEWEDSVIFSFLLKLRSFLETGVYVMIPFSCWETFKTSKLNTQHAYLHQGNLHLLE